MTTTEVHPGERHLYTVPLEGGARTKADVDAGSNDAMCRPTNRRSAWCTPTATSRPRCT